jgi:hypothetical protein
VQIPADVSRIVLPSWLSKFVDSRWVSRVLLVVGWLAAALVGLVPSGWWRVSSLAFGVTAVVCASLLVDRETRIAHEQAEIAGADAKSAREAAEEAVTELIVVLGLYFEPIAEMLARMVGTSQRGERQRLGGLLMQKVVEAAAGICGPTQPGITRAAFFELREGELAFVTHHGRGEPPRQTLPVAALDLALAQGSALVLDVETDAPNPEEFASASYRTFISCSVYAGATVEGLLTVDAADSGTLRKRDLRAVVVLAHVLGAGLALQKLGAPRH